MNVTDDRRQTDGRQHIPNVNVSSRSLKTTSEFGVGNGDGWRDWLAGDGGRGRSGFGRHTLRCQPAGSRR